MRLVLSLVFAAAIAASAGTTPTDPRTPVVVELFTSEGCSSCPPAEATLERLRQVDIPNVRVIALEEHVDYWNQLGWVDPFSAPLYRARQTDYAQRFSVEDIYTPQMIVQGAAQFNGTEGNRAIKEIKLAAFGAEPGYQIRLEPRQNPDDHSIVDLTVYLERTGSAKPKAANLILAVTESHLSSNVLRGENTGRQLQHGPVVRSFGVIGKVDQKVLDPAGRKSTLKLPQAWNRENLQAVVFVQERGSGRITTAATADLR